MIEVIVFIFFSAITVRGQDTVNLLNIIDSVDYYNECSFSAKNLTSECVKASCTDLKGKCPYSNTGCSEVSSILGQCLQETGANTCGVAVAHRPICPFNVNLFGARNDLTGICTIKKNTGFLDGLQNATYCVNGNGTLLVNIDAPNITSYAEYTCIFVLDNYTYTAPDIHLKLFMNIAASATINLSTNPPNVTTQIDQSLIQLQTFDFPEIINKLILFLTMYVDFFFKDQGTDVAAANFLAQYAASALQSLQSNCP